ncbi:MAG: hypothetical protein ACLGXA_25265 [Acidobacteriota bacterium]
MSIDRGTKHDIREAERRGARFAVQMLSLYERPWLLRNEAWDYGKPVLPEDKKSPKSN